MQKIFIIIAIFFTFKAHCQKSEDNILKSIQFFKTSLKQNNDTITYISSSNNKKKDCIIFVQGSLPIPLIMTDEKDVNTLLPFDIGQYRERYNIILINRKGVPLIGDYNRDNKGFYNGNNNVPPFFVKFDNLKYRAYQLSQVIKHLRIINSKNKIFLIGHSEGYRVVASSVKSSKTVNKIVCMSADPFNRITSQILKIRLKSNLNSNDSISQANINMLTSDFKNIGNDIEKYKSDFELYNWMSYNSGLAYKNLLLYKNPILIVYGSKDYDALNNDLLPFLMTRSKLDIRVYNNLDHNFFDRVYDNNILIKEEYLWDKVFGDTIKWLEI